MQNLHIRAATEADLPELVQLFVRARAYMEREGNRTQWISPPGRERLAADLARGELYLLFSGSPMGRPILAQTAPCRLEGAFVFQAGEEPTYAHIEGAWPLPGPYRTLHRVASAGYTPRLFSHICAWAFARSPQLRIDTHADNRSMRRALEQNGFQFCGRITLEDGSPRQAYLGLASNGLQKEQP